MRLYMVRHAKSDAYEQRKRQTPESPLSELGKRQACLLADRVNGLGIDVLVSSEWTRARETAQILVEKTGLSLQMHPHLHEQEKPRAVEGIGDDDLINREFIRERSDQTRNLNFDWKYMGEGESLNELLTRAKKVVQELTQTYGHKRVLLVTHGVFMAALMIVMIFGTSPDKQSVVDFLLAFNHHNAGLTIMDYDESSKQWGLVSFNDHSHLPVE